MPALPALTAATFGTTQLILTYADGRIFYVNYKDIICNLYDPTTGEITLKIYQDGQITLVISATDLVAIGTTISAFLTSLNIYVANNSATSSLGSKMEVVTGAVTGKAYTALMINASCSFSTLTDSASNNLLSAAPTGLNLSGITCYTGMIIRANDGRTIESVTPVTGNVFAFYN
jgi:tRNA threonylcarbamoyladenosine modification (KEOPS) complex  Pcc1 subunit